MIKNFENIQLVSFSKVLRAKHIAIPSEHGVWIYFFSPLVIGLATGGLSKGSFPLVLAMLSAFLIRQPVMVLVKIFSGRRPKNDLYASLIWFLIMPVFVFQSGCINPAKIHLYSLSGCIRNSGFHLASLACQ